MRVRSKPLCLRKKFDSHHDSVVPCICTEYHELALPYREAYQHKQEEFQLQSQTKDNPEEAPQAYYPGNNGGALTR